MSDKEQLIRKFFLGVKLSRKELEQLLDQLKDDPKEQYTDLMQELWEQFEDYEEIEEPLASELVGHTFTKMQPGHESKERLAKEAHVVSHRSFIQRRRFLFSSAAAILLLICSYIGWFWWNDNQFITHKSDYGQQRQIELPDQSIVMLNANSSVKFKKDWDGKEIRKVWLNGEAYFTVSRNEAREQKFQVITKDLTVEVLGTVFNVNAYQESTNVFLEEGKVRINIPEQEQDLIVVPGEIVSYERDTETIVRKKMEEEEPASWKDGNARMSNAKLSAIVQRLEDIYGIRVDVVKESALDRTFNVNIPVNDLEMAHVLLQNLTGLNIVNEGDKWIIK